MKPPTSKASLQEEWKEVIDTCVENQDPHYSFELFEGLLEKHAKLKVDEVFEEITEKLSALKFGLMAGIIAKVDGKDEENLQKYTDKLIDVIIDYINKDIKELRKNKFGVGK